MRSAVLVVLFLALATGMAWRHAHTDDRSWQRQLTVGMAVSIVVAGVIAIRALL